MGGRSPASENVFKKAIVVYFLEIQDISTTLRKGGGGTGPDEQSDWNPDPEYRKGADWELRLKLTSPRNKSW